MIASILRVCWFPAEYECFGENMWFGCEQKRTPKVKGKKKQINEPKTVDNACVLNQYFSTVLLIENVCFVLHVFVCNITVCFQMKNEKNAQM